MPNDKVQKTAADVANAIIDRLPAESPPEPTRLEKVGEFFLNMMEFGWPGVVVLVSIVLAAAWLGHLLIPIILKRLSHWLPGGPK